MNYGHQSECFTETKNVAFIELGWNPSTMSQAEDRVHRIGQHNAINAYYLVARNTIEETIAGMIESKSGAIDAILDGKDAPEFNLLTRLLEGL